MFHVFMHHLQITNTIHPVRQNMPISLITYTAIPTENTCVLPCQHNIFIVLQQL